LGGVTGRMEHYSVGDLVEMLVNGWPVDSGTVREIVEDRETGATIVVIDWQKAGRLRQLVGELRKRKPAAPKA
jgi:hypothetical protein